jgi:hypothetical protein
MNIVLMAVSVAAEQAKNAEDSRDLAYRGDRAEAAARGPAHEGFRAAALPDAAAQSAAHETCPWTADQ